jgi:hypothetical protein
LFAVGESAATIARARLLSRDRVLLVGQDLALAQRQLARPLDGVDLALLVCLAKGDPDIGLRCDTKGETAKHGNKGEFTHRFLLG